RPGGRAPWLPPPPSRGPGGGGAGALPATRAAALPPAADPDGRAAAEHDPASRPAGLGCAFAGSPRERGGARRRSVFRTGENRQYLSVRAGTLPRVPPGRVGVRAIGVVGVVTG
ncbi:hypothetical protein, partial [Isoptericola haloaureus]